MTLDKSEATGDAADDIWLRLAPLAFALLWSTGYIGAKLGTPYVEPFTFLTLRFALAFCLLGLIALAVRAPWPRGRAGLHSIVVGALIHGLYLGGAFWAIDLGMPTGICALIIGLQPLMTALLAGAMVGERVSLWHWVGLILGLAGLVLVLGPKLNLEGSGITPFTVGLMLVSVACLAVGTLYQKRFASDADVRSGVALQYVGAFAVCAVVSFSFESQVVDWTGEFIFALTWLVLVLSLGAIALLMVMIRRGAVSKTAAVFYLVPPITALMGWLLFGETLIPVQFLGMAVTILGVAVAMRPGRDAKYASRADEVM
jgi:drug/metabolite transporter (DMT)-like permease